MNTISESMSADAQRVESIHQRQGVLAQDCETVVNCNTERGIEPQRRTRGRVSDRAV